jgi:hypothetical protein
VDLIFGQDEDHWDLLTTGQEPNTWASEVETALNSTKSLVLKIDTRNKRVAESMWKIVLAERKLAEEEKQRSPDT